jgi:hypothetical protein
MATFSRRREKEDAALHICHALPAAFANPLLILIPA